jgi:DNA-binding phage protein
MIREAGSVDEPVDEPDEALQRHALDDLDALVEAVAEARKDLRSYQAVIEKNRRHLAQGGRASDMAVRFNVQGVRASLTDRLEGVERRRNASRISLWRLQVSEGRTIAEIARIWGLSRQLISRALRSADVSPGEPDSTTRRN